jgi:hypothetical protein
MATPSLAFKGMVDLVADAMVLADHRFETRTDEPIILEVAGYELGEQFNAGLSPGGPASLGATPIRPNKKATKKQIEEITANWKVQFPNALARFSADYSKATFNDPETLLKAVWAHFDSERALSRDRLDQRDHPVQIVWTEDSTHVAAPRHSDLHLATFALALLERFELDRIHDEATAAPADGAGAKTAKPPQGGFSVVPDTDAFGSW